MVGARPWSVTTCPVFTVRSWCRGRLGRREWVGVLLVDESKDEARAKNRRREMWRAVEPRWH